MTQARSYWRTVAIYFGFWTLIGLTAALQNIVDQQLYPGKNDPWTHIVVAALLNWWTCGIGTPIYVWLVRAYPLRGRIISWTGLLYLAVMVVCVPIKFLVWFPLQTAILGTHFPPMLTSIAGEFFAVFLDQFYFLALLSAVEYYRTSRNHELAASQLQAELSQAQLQTLRSQLQPHFLFNTLNSIAALMHYDVKAAEEMLTRLSEMLRLTLESSEGQEVQLRNELEILNLYLQIMHVRFGERLSTNVDFASSLLEERVPSFLLQPLVENAVRHGIDASSKMTHIRVSGSVENGMLTLRIVDDGRGLPQNQEIREGFGLRNTRRRLEQLYGDAGKLLVSNRDGGGTEVVVTIPRRIVPSLP